MESASLKLILLAVGVVLLDYSSQAAINPCEALVSDIVAEVNTSSGNILENWLHQHLDQNDEMK